MFSIKHGDYLNILYLFKHGTGTIHWLLACRADDAAKYQSHDCSNSPLPKSRIILSEIGDRNESKSRDLETPNFPPHELSSSSWRSLGTRVNSRWECRHLHPVSLVLRPLEFISFLFACADNFSQLPADLGLCSFWICRRLHTTLYKSSSQFSLDVQTSQTPQTWCWDLLSAGLDLNSRPWEASRLFSKFIT